MSSNFPSRNCLTAVLVLEQIVRDGLIHFRNRSAPVSLSFSWGLFSLLGLDVGKNAQGFPDGTGDLLRVQR